MQIKENTEQPLDERPANCRFRLQEERKAYPRSSCPACGRTTTTGLGVRCQEVNLVMAAGATPQADADGWIPWAGGECPERANLEVQVKTRSGHLQPGEAQWFWWGRDGAKESPADIIAYRLVKPAPDAAQIDTDQLARLGELHAINGPSSANMEPSHTFKAVSFGEASKGRLVARLGAHVAEKAEPVDPPKSLRDEFAIAALAGIMSQSHQGPKDWQSMGFGWGEDAVNSLNKHETYVAVTIAGFAYQLADAMMAARRSNELRAGEVDRG